MTKNTTRTPVYLDPGMHPGLEVKGLTDNGANCDQIDCVPIPKVYNIISLQETF